MNKTNYENIPLHPHMDSRWDLPTGTYYYNPNAMSDGKKVGLLLISCPRGKEGDLHVATLPHEVKEDGTVNPSIVCPYEGCDWHIFGQLLGWQWGHRPDQGK